MTVFDYWFSRCSQRYYQLPHSGASLHTEAMRPEPNDLSGRRGPATRHFLQSLLLPILMAVAWGGCKQDAKVADKADESRPATNLSSTSTSEPAAESRVWSIGATASPASCAVGERTTITAVVFDGQGRPAPGAKVQVSAGGGRFLPAPDDPYDPTARLHGPYSASGTSDQEGRFVTWWAVNPAIASYVMDIRATKEGWGQAQTNLQIVIKK